MNEKVSVSRQIPAAADVIFDMLSNPHRHAETDGSGMVRSLDQGDRIKEVGDTFTVNMTKEDGDYQTENTVFAFAEGRTIGWKNDRNITDDVPVGAKWLWELEPIDAGNTNVTLTYDASEIEDAELRAGAIKSFDESHLEDSLSAVASADA